MYDWYSLNHIIAPSRCGADGLLAPESAFSMFMDIAGMHAQALGVGMVPMLERHLFWLTVRTKVRYLRRPGMLEEVTLATRPIAPSEQRCVREYRMSHGDEPLLLGKTEWAVMDTRTGAVVPMAGIFPPDAPMAAAPDFDAPFRRVRGSLTQADALGEYTVRSTDIDLGGHMNNAAYVRALLGLYPAAKLREAPPREIEIIFLSPCYEGETLTFRARTDGEHQDVAGFRSDGKLSVLGIVDAT